MYKYLKVIHGNVIEVNDAGNPGMTYWRKNNATRAYWSSLGDKYVEGKATSIYVKIHLIKDFILRNLKEKLEKTCIER